MIDDARQKCGNGVVLDSKQALVTGLAQSHGDQLRGYLLGRVRNPSDIPDIIQEVYLRILRVPNHETIRSPEAYLFTVAKHVAQQYGLRQSAESIVSDLQDMLAASSEAPNDPALEVSAQQSLEELERALQNLSPKARDTFLYYRRDGMTLEQIGARLGVSRPQVKKYLAKALAQFRKQLEVTE
jgi:RNA polymerase sigma factor (sigma-70 family)